MINKIKLLIFILSIIFSTTTITLKVYAETKTFNMVFVPASEKDDAKDFASLIKIVEKNTGFKINFIKVTDYNAAVEAMRANRAQLAWYGGSTYIKASEIAGAEAFAAGVKPGQKDGSYLAYFVVRNDSPIKKFSDIKGKTLSLNHIGSTSGDLIPQVELKKINLSVLDKASFKNVFYAGSHDACLLSVINKKSDVCGMSSLNFDARIKDKTIKSDQVRIIHKSDPVPPAPLAYSNKLSDQEKDKIKKAVLSAHKYGEIGGYGGKMSHYVSVQDSDYNILREVARLIKNPKK